MGTTPHHTPPRRQPLDHLGTAKAHTYGLFPHTPGRRDAKGQLTTTTRPPPPKDLTTGMPAIMDSLPKCSGTKPQTSKIQRSKDAWTIHRSRHGHERANGQVWVRGAVFTMLSSEDHEQGGSRHKNDGPTTRNSHL